MYWPRKKILRRNHSYTPSQPPRSTGPFLMCRHISEWPSRLFHFRIGGQKCRVDSGISTWCEPCEYLPTASWWYWSHPLLNKTEVLQNQQQNCLIRILLGQRDRLKKVYTWSVVYNNNEMIVIVFIIILIIIIITILLTITTTLIVMVIT